MVVSPLPSLNIASLIWSIGVMPVPPASMPTCRIFFVAMPPPCDFLRRISNSPFPCVCMFLSHSQSNETRHLFSIDIPRRRCELDYRTISRKSITLYTFARPARISLYLWAHSVVVCARTLYVSLPFGPCAVMVLPKLSDSRYCDTLPPSGNLGCTSLKYTLMTKST